MIARLFKAIGAVLLLIIAAAIAIVSLYFSYIIGIGLVVVGCIYIAYHILASIKTRKSNLSRRRE